MKRLAVWGSGLMLMAAPASAQEPPRLSVSSLAFVVDSATWHHLIASPFLAEQFAASGRSGVPSLTQRWPVLEIYGRHVYLRFMPPGGRSNAQVGDADITLAVETGGDLDRLMARAAAAGLPFDTATAMLTAGPEPTPWYRVWRPGGEAAPSARTRFEVIEYTTAMAERVAGRDSLPTTDRSRSRFLPTPWDSTRLVRDVEGAEIALPPMDIARIRDAILRLGGASVEPEGEGAVIVLYGFRLHLIPAFDHPGVRQVEFGLRHAVVANPVFRFGAQSKLKFGPGARATWDF